MCLREMVPVRAVPTARCSAKVKYCTKARGQERIGMGREDIRKEVCQSSEPEVGSVGSPGKRKSEPAVLPF